MDIVERAVSRNSSDNRRVEYGAFFPSTYKAKFRKCIPGSSQAFWAINTDGSGQVPSVKHFQSPLMDILLDLFLFDESRVCARWHEAKVDA